MKSIALVVLLALSSLSACKKKEAEEQPKAAPVASAVSSASAAKVEGVPCADMQNAAAECIDRLEKNAGKTYAWKVTKTGIYTFKVTPTGKDKAMRLWPKLAVTKGAETIVSEHSDEDLKATAHFEKADYSITISDVDEKHIETITGGAGFKLAITLDK